ncbi:hypothetical protein l11_02460 [Neisseria weaveri LMG 5135]|nr:hypothetical protein l11_02460 [Neisseria weaveri LMG 5135]
MICLFINTLLPFFSAASLRSAAVFGFFEKNLPSIFDL